MGMLAFFKKPLPQDDKISSAWSPDWLRPKGDSFVRIGNTDYQIRSWGLDGFLAAPYDGALIYGQKARVSVTIRDIHDPEGALSIDAEITVTGIDEHGLRAKWHKLPRYKRMSLENYYTRKAKA